MTTYFVDYVNPDHWTIDYVRCCVYALFCVCGGTHHLGWLAKPVVGVGYITLAGISRMSYTDTNDMDRANIYPELSFLAHTFT
jgi:hypothetical protein